MFRKLSIAMVSRQVPFLILAFWLVTNKGDGEVYSIPVVAIVIPKQPLLF